MGLAAITVGVLAIFVVFRHWSRDEHEALFELSIDQKDIKIRGDLAVEVLIACSFMLVFAPIAFAQLQANDYGFELPQGAGPFTFLIYTLIETLKAGSLVAYYDLFAGQLGYEELTPVRNPSIHAKWVVLSYRLALNLLILATLKRLLDIGRRRAEGLDLRHIEDMLRGQDASAHKDAVEQLKTFALAGRGNAPLLLERILTPAQSDDWKAFDADVRLAAAGALYDYGERRGGTGAFYAAVAAYRRIVKDDYTREAMPTAWAATQNNLGTVLRSLGDRESGTVRLEEAATAYRAALEVYTREAMPTDWAATQNNLGNVLQSLGERESGTVRLEAAAAAYRAALEVYTREAMPTDWAATQNSLGTALRSLGDRESGTVRLEEAATAYRAALEVYAREAMPTDWAATQNNLGNVLQSLGERESGTVRLEAAAAAYRAALEVYTREAMPTDWAMTQNNLGNVLRSLGEREGGTVRLEAAAAAYRAALEVYTREAMPTDWARTQNNLGIVLQASENAKAGRCGWRRQRPPAELRWRSIPVRPCRPIGR